MLSAHVRPSFMGMGRSKWKRGTAELWLGNSPERPIAWFWGAASSTYSVPYPTSFLQPSPLDLSWLRQSLVDRNCKCHFCQSSVIQNINHMTWNGQKSGNNNRFSLAQKFTYIEGLENCVPTIEDGKIMLEQSNWRAYFPFLPTNKSLWKAEFPYFWS